MKNLRFLRFCLGIDSECPVMDNDEWLRIYDFCIKQSMIGIGFVGCEKVPDNNRPSKELILNWYAQTRQIEELNQLMNDRCQDMQTMFAQAGFSTCILKGQGNASMYPNPLRRQSGDIDIWVDGKADDIYEYVKRKCPNAIRSYHHIDFPIFKDTVAEVHYRPSYLNIPWFNHRLQEYFINESNKQCKIALDSLSIPTAEFNMIFQMSHMMRHFLSEGIGLRHIIDYYYLLLSESAKNVDKKRIEFDLKNFGMLKFARGVMWVEQHCLRLEDEFLIVKPNQRVGKLIFKEILNTGNFGKGDRRFAKCLIPISTTLSVMVRNISLFPVFPLEAFFTPIMNVWYRLRYKKNVKI